MLDEAQEPLGHSVRFGKGQSWLVRAEAGMAAVRRGGAASCGPKTLGSTSSQAPRDHGLQSHQQNSLAATSS